MKKTLLSILCIGLLASTENTAQASLPAHNTEKTELGQETNLTMADVKKTQAWKLMPERLKKLIDEKRPEFGVFLKDYPDTGLMSIYKGDDWEIAISRDGSGCFVYPKKVTKDILANPLPQKGKIVNPKTGKPWIPHSSIYKSLNHEDKAYENAMLLAVNEVIHLVMLDYTDEKDVKKLKNEIIGMVMLQPMTRSLNEDEKKDLTEDQINAYNLFGKVVWNQLEQPVHLGLNVYSACTGKQMNIGENPGDFFPVVTYRGKPLTTEFNVTNIKGLEREGKINVIKKAQQGLEKLLEENNLDKEKIADPNATLNERQASVSYIYQTVMPIFDNMLNLKDLQRGGEYNLWIVRNPSKNMMSYEKEIFKNDTKVILPKKIIKTNDVVKTHE